MKKLFKKSLLALSLASMAFTGFSFAENKEIAIVKADVECNDITFDNELDSTFTGGPLTTGNYYLSSDVTITSPITIASTETVNICLNGYVVVSNVSTTDNLFTNNGSLGIYDSNTASGETVVEVKLK